jgi:serine/threonine protein kinase
MLSPGTRLGPYEILTQLGAGGMGEVYRARHETLGRDIAIKVLPAHLAADGDAQYRFEREARAVAALSHPNVLSIHDFGVCDGHAFAVMELLEGENLRTRLLRAPMSFKQALTIAQAIADGLAAVHRKGITHRDLKPENIFLTNDGRVKILDFGIAKLDEATKIDDDTLQATLELKTLPGTVLGTVGYMSPEQVRGFRADARSDIFSFGCVLFEMMTGKRPFTGESGAEVTASILRDDPFLTLPDEVQLTDELHRIIARCLEKSPENRFQSAQDLAFLLKTLSEPTSSISARRTVSTISRIRVPRQTWKVVVAAICLAALAGSFWLGRRSRPVVLTPTYTYLTNSGEDSSPAASPDGKFIAFSSRRDRKQRIWTKQMAGGVEVPITAGSDDHPRYSPDGATILFTRRGMSQNSLFTVSALGGEARKVLDDATDGDWAPDGQHIIFSRWIRTQETTSTYVGVADRDGGNVRQLAVIAKQRLYQPRCSPDGKTIALVKDVVAGTALSPVFTVDVKTGSIKEISPPESGGYLSNAVWLGDGRMLAYAQATAVDAPNILSAARIHLYDTLTGTTRAAAWIPTDTPVMDVLADGTLIYETRSQRGNMFEIDQDAGLDLRNTAIRLLTQGTGTDRQPRYTPDGKSVLFSSNRTGNNDVWRLDRETNHLSQLTAHDQTDWDPLLTEDGQTLLWSSNRTGAFEIWASAPDGTRGRQLTSLKSSAQNPTATPDGKVVFFTLSEHPKAGLWRVNIDGTGGRDIVRETPTRWPEVSPDGKYVLYVTNSQSGASVIHVVDIATEKLIPFSIDVGTGASGNGRARWSPDAKSIAFVSMNQENPGIFVQAFQPGADTASTRRQLAATLLGYAPESFAFSPEGKKMTIGGIDRTPNLMMSSGISGIVAPSHK